MQIIKANGEKQEYSEEKVRQSIARAGIPKDMQQEVLQHVEQRLHENISTNEIYRHILEFLDKPHTQHIKARYSLKQAIMELGPTGYPFEDYLSKLLTEQGYTTSVRNMVTGKCITHEIDVIAKKDKESLMVEAKFHNSVGIKTDVHVALYTQARFEDVVVSQHVTKPMLITNTKTTTEVTAYAQCVGMSLMSWDYPSGNSLRENVEKYHLYPVTALSRLPQTFKQQLIEQGIVLCKDICLNPTYIHRLPLSKEEKDQILQESDLLCKQI